MKAYRGALERFLDWYGHEPAGVVREEVRAYFGLLVDSSGGGDRGHPEARDVSHAAAQLRDAPARERDGHPVHPEGARTRADRDDDDLHARGGAA